MQSSGRSSRRGLAIGAALLAALGLGALIGRALAGGGTSQPASQIIALRPAAPVQPVQPAPRSSQEGAAGAARAARRILMRLSAPQLLGNPATASKVAWAVAVPAYRDELTARLRAGFSLMAGRLGAPGSGGGLLRLMPLGWRVERFAPPEAQVAIWQVVVLAEPGASRTLATWSTSRLQLRWGAGGWRLAGYLPDEPGPAPAASYPSPATAPGRPAPTVERFRSFTP